MSVIPDNFGHLIGDMSESDLYSTVQFDATRGEEDKAFRLMLFDGSEHEFYLTRRQVQRLYVLLTGAFQASLE